MNGWEEKGEELCGGVNGGGGENGAGLNVALAGIGSENLGK